VSGTLELTLDIRAGDPAAPSALQCSSARDRVPTVHEYVDQAPRNIATPGAIGESFVQLETPVQQVERLVADLPIGADIVLRAGGLPAVVVGTVAGAIAPAGGEAAVFNVDGQGQVTATLQAGDTSIALAAKRFNYAAGAQVASVDPSTGGLRMAGIFTGGADARSKGWQAGSVQFVSGSALSLLGLSVGTTYGAGDDQRLGAGPFVKPFPAGALPRRIELSGTAPGAKFWLAGKAS
jgi:hypothetical protein